ncbi:DUF2971 domain-containing protein [Uliginosibacterium paludis]|uniref:DUF2971 domain-containing protein n=1 Tax=Uliginosibacterium paludis TaxID=1615952 RepID=A0ABV2CUK1_9RHOO
MREFISGILSSSGRSYKAKLLSKFKGFTMHSIPKQLYRYRSIEGEAQARTQRLIETGIQYFAAPTSFNDPFDSRPDFTLSGTEDEVRAYLNEMWSRQAPHISSEDRKREIEAILRDPNRDPRLPENSMQTAAVYEAMVTAKIGVMCLSAVRDSVLMWSHYADCHRGICLVYDTSDEFFATAQPVHYQHARPQANPIAHTPEEMLDNAIFTKSDAWSYEQEWRILHYQRGPGERQMPPNCLRAVLLGVAASDSTRRLVESWAKSSEAKPQVIRARLSPSAFEIQFPGDSGETSQVNPHNPLILKGGQD